MSEHFVGKYEIELKFRVADIAVLRQRVIAFGGQEFVAENQEHDTYFECATSLEQQNISMLVRDMSPSGIKLWIVKGPGSDRCEAVNITSVEKTISMLNTLGYRRAFTLEKLRSIYFIEQFHITLDRVSGIGEFAEIAIMTNDQAQLATLRIQCQDLAERLGLAACDNETRSYRQLLGH